MRLNQQSKFRGFTLIEVLVAMVILTVAMLGIASLHLVSLENSNSSYLRAQSVAISEDIIERIRHNSALKQYAINNDIDSATEGGFASSSELANCTDADGCDDDQLALVELQDWVDTLERLGQSTSTSSGGTPPVNVTLDYDSTNKVFDLSVNWEMKQWQAPDLNSTTPTEHRRARQNTSYQFLVAIN